MTVSAYETLLDLDPKIQDLISALEAARVQIEGLNLPGGSKICSSLGNLVCSAHEMRSDLASIRMTERDMRAADRK